MVNTFEQNIVQDKSDIKNQLGNSPNILPIPKFFNESISVDDYIAKQETLSILGSFIIGHETFAQRDYTPLEITYGEPNVISVIPRDNLFIEYFSNDLFIADSSTGTIDTTNETYSLGTEETLESEIIYKTDKVPKSIEITEPFTDDYAPIGSFFLDISPLAETPDEVGADGLFGGSGIFFISGDGGTTWKYLPTLFGKRNFDVATTDGIKYKMYSFTGIDINSPIKIKITT